MVLASICGCPLSSTGKVDSQVIDINVTEEGERTKDTFKLPEAADLLGLLHRALLEADNILGPMIRYASKWLHSQQHRGDATFI